MKMWAVVSPSGIIEAANIVKEWAIESFRNHTLVRQSWEQWQEQGYICRKVEVKEVDDHRTTTERRKG